MFGRGMSYDECVPQDVKDQELKELKEAAAKLAELQAILKAYLAYNSKDGNLVRRDLRKELSRYI